MQENFTKLLIEEKKIVSWQSIIKKMSRNVLAFATRISTNSLPSPDNLKGGERGKFQFAQYARIKMEPLHTF